MARQGAGTFVSQLDSRDLFAPLALAIYAQVLGDYRPGGDASLETVLPAWEAYADLEQTPAGVALMLQLAAGYTDRGDDAAALTWLERSLPIAERLDLLPQIAAGLARLSGVLYRLDRPRQALILLRGTHELAVANGLVDVHLRTRTSLTFYEQFADPAAGLAMAREGLEIASRQGSALYGFVMVGNAVSCAIRVGEWTWAGTLLDEWLANEISAQFYIELYVDRAVLTALGGADPSHDLDEAARLLPGITDPQYTSYRHWGRAWAAFVTGHFTEARDEAVTAAQVTNYFAPISLPIAARAALWAGDAADATAVVHQVEAFVPRGRAIGLDHLTLRAGIAALEGRRADAIAGYREALRGWGQLGLAFDHAMAVLDMAVLLAPTEREMAEAPAAIETARETLTRLGARPFLARLDEAGNVQAASSAAQTPGLPARSAGVPGDAPVGR